MNCSADISKYQILCFFHNYTGVHFVLGAVLPLGVFCKHVMSLLLSINAKACPSSYVPDMHYSYETRQ